MILQQVESVSHLVGVEIVDESDFLVTRPGCHRHLNTIQLSFVNLSWLVCKLKRVARGHPEHNDDHDDNDDLDSITVSPVQSCLL